MPLYKRFKKNYRHHYACNDIFYSGDFYFDSLTEHKFDVFLALTYQNLLNFMFKSHVCVLVKN